MPILAVMSTMTVGDISCASVPCLWPEIILQHGEAQSWNSSVNLPTPGFYQGTPPIKQPIEDKAGRNSAPLSPAILPSEKRLNCLQLADDFQPLGISLRKHIWLAQRDFWRYQPREIEAMKARELEPVSATSYSKSWKGICCALLKKLTRWQRNGRPAFETIFANSVSIRRLDELLDTFSVRAVTAMRRSAIPAMPPLLDCCFGGGAYYSSESAGIILRSLAVSRC